MKLIRNIKNWYILSDTAIIKELGKQLQQMRLNKNLTQGKLSEITGLDRVTISKVENGRAATLLTFVQLLRALDKLQLLEAFDSEPEISPMQVAEMQAKYRKRASKKKPDAPSQYQSEW
jgi:transcriptional regulator with XRE-family HTH domain